MHNLVPHFILNQYAAGERNGRFPATALFVDISGFSTITDALMQHGQHGAEVLATVMRTLFDPLVHTVFAQRGFIVGFAGDSFTAVFRHDDDPDVAAARAVTAAWQMQEQIAAIGTLSTAYGPFTLSAKAGISAGEVAWGIVTAADGKRASYYFQGTAIDGCASAEKAASSGDILLDGTLYEQVQAEVTAEAVGELYRVTAVSSPLSPPQAINLPPADLDSLSRFFPTALITQSHPGEFRQVVNLFISLPTVRTEAQLSIFMQSLFELQERYGGLLNRLDFGDKGSHLLLFWGAPAAHENDVERALNFILDLQTQTSIPINAGITYRIAHAGFIGSSLHEEYTCYGRGVNLAARFMTAAPRGEIWVDENIARQASRHFEIDYEGERSFKGFAHPQPVHALLERKEQLESLYQGELVGREGELAQLAEFIQPIFQGQCAGAMVVWGEPGIGKSRLVHEFRSTPLFQEEDVLWALCQSDEILRQSLNPFRYWLRRYFDQSVEQSDARNKRNFNRKLDDLIGAVADAELETELDRIRSFLGALIGLSWPDSLYEQVDGQGRYENTFVALTTLLTAESRRQPVVLIIEDAHWLDDDSKAYLPRLSQELTKKESDYPVAILATARFEGTGLPLGEALQGQEINLGGLTQEDLSKQAQDILEDPVAPAVVEYLMQRAEGNPFFAEQIVRYLQEEGLLVQQGTTWEMVREGANIALPTDVRAVLVARVDRLTQSVKEVVQTASVLGREFELRLLAQMLHNDQAITQKVKQAEQSAIWSALSEIRYIFKHALLRDTVYQMQVRQQRQALHALAVTALESLYGDDLQPHYGELAYHALAAELWDEAFRYSIAAGDEAMHKMALSDAIDHYSRAIDCVARVDAVASEQLVHLYTRRGRAYELDNEFEQALDDYQSMVELAEERDDRALRLASLTAQCIVRATGTPLYDPPQAKALADEALSLAQELGDRATESRVLWGLLLLSQYGGVDLEQALAYGRRSLAIARELGLTEQIGYTLHNLAPLFMTQERYEEAHQANLEERAAWLEVGNTPLLADSYIVTASLHVMTGDYQAILTAAQEALRISRSIGNKWVQSVAPYYTALALLDLGEVGQAHENVRRGLKIAEEEGITFFKYAGYTHLILLYLSVGALDAAEPLAEALYRDRDQLIYGFYSSGLTKAARLKLAQDDLPQAQKIHADSLQDVDADNAPLWFMAEVTVTGALLQLALGQPEGALSEAQQLVGRTRQASMKSQLTEALLIQGKALATLEELDEAAASLQEAAQVAEEIGQRRLLWQIQAALAEVEMKRGNGVAAQTARSRAREVIEYIADHAGDDELRQSFLSLPEVQRVVVGEG